MFNIARRSWLLLLALLLAGCASGPLKTEGVSALTPGEAAGSDSVGETVLWGGVIVNATNLPERTRLEIVSYPLDSRSQRPRIDAEPGGRFLAYKQGYLETAEYGRGRRVTVRGDVTGSEQGQVGEAPYTYPTVEVEALELWPEARSRGDGSRFRFGVGVIFSN